MINLFEQLLNDEKYKQLTEDLSEEDLKIVEEQMKNFMSNLEEGIFNPLAGLLSQPNVGKELRKIYEKKTLGDLIKKNG